MGGKQTVAVAVAPNGYVEEYGNVNKATSSNNISPQHHHHDSEKAARALNAIINKTSKQQLKQENEKIKLVVLGAQAAGKSTVLNQVRRLYADPRTISPIGHVTKIGDVFMAIVTGAIRLGWTHAPEHCLDTLYTWTTLEFLAFYDMHMKSFIEEHAASLPDDFSLDYLVYNTIPRLRDHGNEYAPTHLDQMRAMSPRVGIIMESFIIDGVQFQIADVSTQSGDMRKFRHMFSDMTAAIFVHNSSAMMDDLDESLRVFDETMNSRSLYKVPILLFFNKTDMLTGFLASGKVFKHGDKFASSDLKQVQEYLLNQFIKLNGSDSDREVYHLFTTMTDNATVHVTFNASKDIILKNNLRSSGFMD